MPLLVNVKKLRGGVWERVTNQTTRTVDVLFELEFYQICGMKHIHCIMVHGNRLTARM